MFIAKEMQMEDPFCRSLQWNQYEALYYAIKTDCDAILDAYKDVNDLSFTTPAFKKSTIMYIKCAIGEFNYELDPAGLTHAIQFLLESNFKYTGLGSKHDDDDDSIYVFPNTKYTLETVRKSHEFVKSLKKCLIDAHFKCLSAWV